MRWVVWFVLLACLLSPASAQKVMLKSFQWKKTGDSIRMEFGLSDGARPRYRIRSCNELTEKPCLHVELSGVGLDERGFKNHPDWIEQVLRSDSSILDMRVALTQSTPWKFSWEGRVLRVDILDRTVKKSVWKNPWMVGGIGAGLLAGGVAIWFTSEAPQGAPAGSNLIPPPDVELPK